jgi:hypothetical protein
MRAAPVFFGCLGLIAIGLALYITVGLVGH